MKKRTVFHECLLTAAIAVIPGVCLAGDAPRLKPVTTETSLRQVPRSENEDHGIQQVAYQPSGQTSTVEAELKKLFQENGQVIPAVQTPSIPQNSGPEISLVKHAKDPSDARNEKRKPGPLKRWFRRMTGQEAEPESTDETTGNPQQAGTPGPRIPAPPPIDFTIRNNGQKSNTRGVPAQAVGFHQGRPQASPHSAVPGANGVEPLVPAAGEFFPQNAHTDPRPQQRQSPPDNGFINPFDGEDLTQQEDTLLDLDSLITGHNSVAEGTKNALPVQVPPQESLIPATPVVTPEERVKAVVAPQPQQRQTPGPFTGYRLPADDQVLGLPETEPTPQIIKERQTSPEPVNVSTPNVETYLPHASESATVVQVPLLEETAPTPRQAADVVAEDSKIESEPVRVTVEAATIEKPSEVPAPQSSDGQPAIAQDLRALDNSAKREQQRYRIMARSGKTGFKGFCPVELRDRRELIDSREQYRSKFGLQTYYFSSPEARSAFEANPARYAPAGGGSDVVLLVNTGEEAPGSLDFSLWYRDRLYMFRSRETQAIFSKDPRRFADQY